MYRRYLMNFGYFADAKYETLEAAIQAARSACFEASIYQGKQLVAFWSPIGGLRMYR